SAGRTVATRPCEHPLASGLIRRAGRGILRFLRARRHEDTKTQRGQGYQRRRVRSSERMRPAQRRGVSRAAEALKERLSESASGGGEPSGVTETKRWRRCGPPDVLRVPVTWRLASAPGVRRRGA